MTTRAPWFGNLLNWRYDPQSETHVTRHGDRSHRITKVTHRTADTQGGGLTPGWHLWDDERDPDRRRWDDGYGPGLGRWLGRAKREAEAWIICPYQDMMGYPALRLALGAGAVWENNRAVYTIQAADAFHRFTVERVGGRLIAEIVPEFTGRGGTTTIRWQVQRPDGTPIGAVDTWAGAIRELETALAAERIGPAR